MKYYAIYDATNTIYAYTPSELGAQTVAAEIGGRYEEAPEDDL